jgi:hypothetical protein
VTKIFVEHEFLNELLNLPPQTLVSWNDLTLANCDGCITKLNLMGSLGTLAKMMGRGLTIPHYEMHSYTKVDH